MKRGVLWGLVVLLGLAGWCSPPAFAQSGFEVLIDTDSPNIGCDYDRSLTPPDVFEGIERIVTVTVSADGSQITALSIRSCNPFNGSFDSPQPLSSPPGFADLPLPIGSGGIDGASVLEFAVGAAQLGNPATVRLGLISLDGDATQDTLLTRNGQPDGGPLAVVLIPAPIPTLTPWTLALLVGLLGAGLWLGRRLRRHPLLLSLLISGLLIGVVWAIELDGDPGDWAGIDPLGTDPTGDGQPDIVALFATAMNGALVLRIDALLNQPPVAQDDAFTVDADTVLNGDVLADNGNGADSDPDNDPLTVIAVNGAAGDVDTEITLNSGALLTLNSDGSFTYDPNGAFDALQVGDDPGEDSFTYTLGDNRGGTDTATVTITLTPVNDPPTPQNDDFTVAEGGTLDDSVRTNDSDPDNALADLAVTTTPVSGPSQAAAFTLNADGSFSYTHDGSETTSDSFDYEICDPEPLCATATVTITVTPVNDAPVLDFPTPGTVNYDPFADEPVILDPAATVTDVDSTDFDGGVLTANITTNCNDNDRIGVNDQGVGADQISVSGTDVSFGDPALLIGTLATEFDCTTADPLLSVTLTADATLPAVQALLRNLTFSTSDDTSTDPRTVEVTASDGDGGTSNTVSRQVTLDQAPRLTSTSPADSATGVALDSNIMLTFSESVTFSGIGTTLTCDGNGVTFAVSGSPGTVITLDPDSDLPSSVTCTVDVAATDVADDDAIDPPDHLVADASFGFITVDEPPVVETVVPADGADPVAGDTDITLTFSENVNVTGNWAQVNCDSSGIQDVNSGLSVTDSNPTFTLDPATDFAAGETCTVTVFAAQVKDTDGIAPAEMASNFTSTFTIDAAPEIMATTPIDSATGVEPNAVVIIDFSEAVTVAGGAIGVSCDGSAQSFALGMPDGDTVTLTPTSTWTPGTACTVTLMAASITDTDAVDPPDQLIGTTSFGFGVKPVADADGPFAVTGNIQIAIAASGVYAGDQRGINTLATVDSFDASSSQGGNVSVNADGSFTYNPPAGFTGNDSFTYTISNTNGTSDPATVSLTVSDRVWFIDNSQSCPGDGRFTDPFCIIANFNGATTFSGDYIALRTGAYSEADGINLGNGQILIGNAVQFDTVFSASINSIQAYKTFAAGTAAAPTIVVTGSGNHGVQLAQNNTVRGLNVGNTTGTGAGLFGNTAGTVTVSDVSITGQGIGVNITNGTLAASFDNISSSNNAGILLNSVSGDFDVTTGTITAGSNTAVSIVGNPSIDLGVTLTSVSVNGAANGIVLTNTTGNSGGFTVTGTGSTDSSGGTIQNITQRGVEAIGASNISLSNMTLTNANTTDGATSDGTSGGNENTDENGAIHLQNVSTVDLINVDINGTVQHGINGNLVTDLDITDSTIQNTGDEVWESAVYIFQLRGTQADGTDSVFSNTTINNTGQFNIFVRNNAATNAAPGAMDRLELANMTFQNSGVDVAGDHVTISNRDTANFQTVVTGSSFDATPGDTSDSIQVDAGNTSRSDASITDGSDFINGNLAVNISGSGTANTTFDVSSNPSISSRASSGVNIAANGSTSMNGTAADNPIITSNLANNNGFGVDVVVDQTGSAVVDIDNNVIRNLAVGIRASARNAGTGTADVTLGNNDIITGGNFAFNAVQLAAGNGSASESNRTCVNLVGNTTDTGFGDDEYFLEQYTGNTFQLQGLTPASGATQAQVENFVAGTDTGMPSVDAFGGTIVNYTAATCITP